MCSYDILSTVFVLGMIFIIIWPKTFNNYVSKRILVVTISTNFKWGVVFGRKAGELES